MLDGEVRLGRLAGFPLAMSWSALLVVWLVAWGTSTTILPQTAPGYGEDAYWLAGLVAAVLFFASLLGHELAHAVVARAAGMEVVGLTLWVFGGVATLRGEPPSPRDDLRIAGVGPLTSLGLGFGFGLLASGMGAAQLPQLAVAVAAWLALVNVLLGVFNLLPGAPLDGGRVLRAYLWRRSGDRLAAAVSASRAGERTGVVLASLGFVEVLAGADVGGLWLVLVGWFVLRAAASEESAARMLQALAGLAVADVMTRSPIAVPDGLTVLELADRLPWRAHATYPLVGPDGSPTGLLRLAALSAVPAERESVTVVGDLAVPLTEAVVARPDEPLTTAVTRTAADGDGRFLVVDGGRIVGIVTPSDLNRVLRLRGTPAARRRPPQRPPASAA